MKQENFTKSARLQSEKNQTSLVTLQSRLKCAALTTRLLGSFQFTQVQSLTKIK
jgi:hypothetical protein